MIGRRTVILAAGAALAGCGTKFRNYSGQKITLIEVHKADRKMYLIGGSKVLKTYNIRLGGSPVGPKQFEGDMKTPEGAYTITHRNPNSRYHLSLGISYPNQADRDYAKSQGKEPGGDIFIHGGTKGFFEGRNWLIGGRDWTAGCIAVKDYEMEEIYAMITPGTSINIYP